MESYDILDTLDNLESQLPTISGEGGEVPASSLSSPPSKPGKTNAWDPRLVLDLAMEVDGLPEILDRYGLSMEEYQYLSSVPAFRRELSLTIRDIKENGASFQRKAKVQAENYLEIMDHLVYSDDTPAGVRLETIRSAVKWANLEPKEEKPDSTQATQINVNISF